MVRRRPDSCTVKRSPLRPFPSPLRIGRPSPINSRAPSERPCFAIRRWTRAAGLEPMPPSDGTRTRPVPTRRSSTRRQIRLNPW